MNFSAKWGLSFGGLWFVCLIVFAYNVPERDGLAELLQQLVLAQAERHADWHLGDEALARLSCHLLAESKVDPADAATALEVSQRLVCHSVTHCQGTKARREEESVSHTEKGN